MYMMSLSCMKNPELVEEIRRVLVNSKDETSSKLIFAVLKHRSGPSFTICGALAPTVQVTAQPSFNKTFRLLFRLISPALLMLTVCVAGVSERLSDGYPDQEYTF